MKSDIKGYTIFHQDYITKIDGTEMVNNDGCLSIYNGKRVVAIYQKWDSVVESEK